MNWPTGLVVHGYIRYDTPQLLRRRPTTCKGAIGGCCCELAHEQFPTYDLVLRRSDSSFPAWLGVLQSASRPQGLNSNPINQDAGAPAAVAIATRVALVCCRFQPRTALV